MLTILFNIIIYPIRLIIECIYAMLSISVFKGNIGLSLALLSLSVSMFCLPLYAKAEHLQEIERDIQKKMAKRIASIKKYFKGDEQYMLLSTYYRENHYHPIMALRSSVSLLLQVPFFIAAYSFLSHLESLSGKSLSFIHDLSAPDALFSVFGFSINILPVVMTFINVIAGVIYTRGFRLSEKVQLYAMSLIFLALLYNSPSALVLYWTMNNIFSLVKNILFKVKNPLRFVYFIGCALAAAFMVYVCFIRYNFPMRAVRNKTFAVAIFALFACIPLYIRFAKYAAEKWLGFLFAETKYTAQIFVISCASIWIFTGCFIPFNLVASDPVQFISIPSVPNIPGLLAYPAVQAMGLFLFWPIYLYFLFSKKVKSLFSIVFAGAAFCVFVNFYGFFGNYGIVSQTLSFNLPDGVFFSGTPLRQLANLAACAAAVALVCLAAAFKKQKWLPVVLGLCVISTGILCITKGFQIKSVLDSEVELRKSLAQNNIRQDADVSEIAPAFTLSKTGKNVFVIMLDMAINAYFPLVLDERPDVRKSFEGFVYYPNTVSFFRRTLFGAPPLFGGYEYTTDGMNKRTDTAMKDKQNEALFLMPEIFRHKGFDVTVSNLPYVNYGQPLESDFYAKRGVKVQNIQGLANKYISENLGLEEYKEPIQLYKLLQRNILMYSVFETSILSLRNIINQNGNYWSTTDWTENAGVDRAAIENWAALYYMPELTEIAEQGGGGSTLTMLANNLTHDAAWLQYPDYTVEAEITEHGDNFFGNNSYKLYHVNAASYILLSKWFDYLRDQGVWDNTRIIIVSDHGEGGITHPGWTSFQNNHILPYNALLLFKDFGASGQLQTDNSFMTNADVPFLALSGIVENPVNPFTGRALTQNKENGAYIFTGGYTNTGFYTGTTCLSDNSGFYHVHDSIFDSGNWAEVQYKDFKDKQ